MVGPLQAPIDYFSQLAPFDIGQSMQARQLQNQQQAMLQAAQERAAQEQAALDQARKEAIANPSAAAFSKLLVLDPKAQEGIKAAWALKDEQQQKADLQEITAIDGLLAANRIAEARSRVQRRRDADAKAGLDTEDDDEMLAVLDDDPASARLYTGSLLAGILGDKAPEVIKTLGTERRDDAKAPVDIAKTAADTTKTLAEAGQIAPNAEAERALKVAQAEKARADIDNAAARLGLDRERLNFDIEAKSRELGIKERDLPDAARSLVNQTVISAAGSRQLAEKSRNLADRLVQANAQGGVGAGLASALTGITGDASAITQMRREYAQLRGQQAIKNLPPGGQVSNKDMETAMKGLPSENASGETIASFLRGVADMQDLVADYEGRKADWLVENRGSLGPARAGFFVGNTFVQPGTRFDDIEANLRKERAKAAAAARVKK